MRAVLLILGALALGLAIGVLLAPFLDPTASTILWWAIVVAYLVGGTIWMRRGRSRRTRV